MSVVERVTWFFGAKRRLLELEIDLRHALAEPTEQRRHAALGRVLAKHDPVRFAQLQANDKSESRQP